MLVSHGSYVQIAGESGKKRTCPESHNKQSGLVVQAFERVEPFVHPTSTCGVQLVLLDGRSDIAKE